MEMFVTVYFVLMGLLLLLTIYRLCTAKYPINVKDTTKSDDILRLIIGIGIVLWSGILLFGDKI